MVITSYDFCPMCSARRERSTAMCNYRVHVYRARAHSRVHGGLKIRSKMNAENIINVERIQENNNGLDNVVF